MCCMTQKDLAHSCSDGYLGFQHAIFLEFVTCPSYDKSTTCLAVWNALSCQLLQIALFLGTHTTEVKVNNATLVYVHKLLEVPSLSTMLCNHKSGTTLKRKKKSAFLRKIALKYGVQRRSIQLKGTHCFENEIRSASIIIISPFVSLSCPAFRTICALFNLLVPF